MIRSISIDNSTEWDDIVKSFQNYDVSYLSYYAKAFHINGEGNPKLLYFNNGKTRAINVIMERDIALSEPFKNKILPDTLYDISTPYGYGGFWIEGDESDLVQQAYECFCQQMGYVSEFVRFHLFSQYEKTFIGQIESPITNVVRTLEPTLDEIFTEIDSNVRRNIKKAVRNGLQIQFDQKGIHLDQFLSMYYATMKRAQAKDQYFFSKQFFDTINCMEDHFVYAFVKLEEEVIASELVLFGSENCYSFLACSFENHLDLKPNDFLKFEVIRWAKEHNLKRYILGGGYGADDGIFKFKKNFAPQGLHKFHIGKKVINETKYQMLLDKRKQDTGFNGDSTLFPQYRA